MNVQFKNIYLSILKEKYFVLVKLQDFKRFSELVIYWQILSSSFEIYKSSVVSGTSGIKLQLGAV